MNSPAPEERFSDRVENYVRYRPGYPAEVWDWLIRNTGIQPGAMVADVGAGTGISAREMLSRGYEVRAVEPNAAMRGAAIRLLGGMPGFQAIDGTAEATTLELEQKIPIGATDDLEVALALVVCADAEESFFFDCM